MMEIEDGKFSNLYAERNVHWPKTTKQPSNVQQDPEKNVCIEDYDICNQIRTCLRAKTHILRSQEVIMSRETTVCSIPTTVTSLH